jgi:hypothetical protein
MAAIAVPDKIHDLVRSFDEAGHDYTHSLNEFTTRTRFIDPLFEALGWNVTRARGAGQLYDEVVFEDTFRMDDTLADVSSIGKRPDYSFRIDGERKFYVEAKKPAESLDSNRAHAFQVRAYGWSARLPVSILTDFEEFSVYDCRVRPDQDDQPSTARLPNFYIRYNQYADRWADIAELLHRDAVAAGSLDRFVENVRPPRGTQTVGAAFLKDISAWRELLARDIAARNPDLSERDLNYAVQMTINRIIFLRICEDRGIEPPETLKGTLMRPYNATEGYVYRDIVRLFERADERYNSGLFHFRDERNRSESADHFTPNLRVGDDTLAHIIGHLYYPYPYKFDVIPVEILGQVYEQFLGKVIVRAPGGDVTVEEKPEVRKAGGVYYTPAYIVDYIVEHTVGRLLEGKTPEQAAALRVLDPACGSGSFLIGAYSYLLDWHLRYYLAHDPERLSSSRRKDRPIEEVPRPASAPKRKDGADERRYRLTVEERKRILLNNIYGVDIDSQAVEVTKLSLLLKVLEGEREGELQSTLRFDPHARVLPDLGDNIKCGNSLIGPDFYQSTQSTFLDLEEARRVNAFDWHAAFPAIMGAGGFDAVIGNPPYIRIQAMKEWAPSEVELYKQRYVAASKGNYDIYVVFVEKGLSLLNENGRLGFILPHKFFNAQYGEPLRGLIAQGKHLSHVVHFGDEQVFAGATTYTCLLFLDKEPIKEGKVHKVTSLADWRQEGAYQVAAINLNSSGWIVTVGGERLLFDRLDSMPHRLRDVADRIFQGIIPGADEVYTVEVVGGSESEARCYSRALKEYVTIETALLRPIISGADVQRFVFTQTSNHVIYPYTEAEGQARLIPPEVLRQDYPHAYQYLVASRSFLDKRDRGSAKGEAWYKYIRTQNIGLQPYRKLAVPRLVSRLRASYDKDGVVCLDNVDVGGVILADTSDAAYLYVLGLLNSRLLDFFFVKNTVPFRGGFYSANRQFIENLPVRTIDSNNPADKARHDRMVQLVERMLALHRQLAGARTPHDKTFLQPQIDATDREIDRLVYDLYDLTEEEIAIVEGRA